jgi:cyanophycinase
MNSGRRIRVLLMALQVLLALPCWAQSDRTIQYLRVGRRADAAHATPRAGYALMGGGTDLDEAFEWLCTRAGGGDFLVLRATGTDAYNSYIRKLCPNLNSVATLIIPNRMAAYDPAVARIIGHAGALFLAGGDQANYINFWMDTPVQEAMNQAIARHIPLGGTSAGLAVMGDWAYTAQGDEPDSPDLSSALAMDDPFRARVTLVSGFLHVSSLAGIITDTHFAARNRMGRLLAFLARLNGASSSTDARLTRGIGVDQRSAVLVEPDGKARVIGNGAAYFIDSRGAHGQLETGMPLDFGPYSIQKVPPGHSFNVRTWSGDATKYTLSVKDGEIHSSQPGGAIY